MVPLNPKFGSGSRLTTGRDPSAAIVYPSLPTSIIFFDSDSGNRDHEDVIVQKFLTFLLRFPFFFFLTPRQRRNIFTIFYPISTSNARRNMETNAEEERKNLERRLAKGKGRAVPEAPETYGDKERRDLEERLAKGNGRAAPEPEPEPEHISEDDPETIVVDDGSALTPSKPKGKRGRPKGSKNKPKIGSPSKLPPTAKPKKPNAGSKNKPKISGPSTLPLRARPNAGSKNITEIGGPSNSTRPAQSTGTEIGNPSNLPPPAQSNGQRQGPANHNNNRLLPKRGVFFLRPDEPRGQFMGYEPSFPQPRMVRDSTADNTAGPSDGGNKTTDLDPYMERSDLGNPSSASSSLSFPTPDQPQQPQHPQPWSLSGRLPPSWHYTREKVKTIVPRQYPGEAPSDDEADEDDLY